jgi:hypothetical protein
MRTVGRQPLRLRADCSVGSRALHSLAGCWRVNFRIYLSMIFFVCGPYIDYLIIEKMLDSKKVIKLF